MDAIAKALADNGDVLAAVLLLGYVPMGAAIVFAWKVVIRALERATSRLAEVKAALDAQADSREKMLLAIAATTQELGSVGEKFDRLERLVERLMERRDA